MARWSLCFLGILTACASSTEPERAPADVGSLEDASVADQGVADAGPSDSGAEDAGVVSGPPRVEEVVGGLEHPWAIEFLPSGEALITERPGRLRRLSSDGQLSEPLAGVPDVHGVGQGGLLDVVHSPEFSSDGRIYFCYAASEGAASGTEVARAQLEESRLSGLEVIFRVSPKVRGGNNHYGCRLAFSSSGHLFIGVGERFDFAAQAQELDNHLGKVMRIHPDGSIPADNPFVGRADALPEIWSYGHRNIQGMATHPESGLVWTHEHGPRGGDEVNRPRAGANHGWPLASYGSHYDGTDIPDDHEGAGFAEPIHYWNPSIAPSGMHFYRGERFPEWRGHLFVGALAFTHLSRLELDGETVVGEHQLLGDRQERIRDVTEGPNGDIYVIVDADDGKVVRITR